MSNLHDVKVQCSVIRESTKIKERKDSLKQLLLLLENSKIAIQIDELTFCEMTEEKIKNELSWSYIVNSVIICIEKECDISSVKKTASKQSNLKKDLPEALRNVVKVADSRGPRLFKFIPFLLKHFSDFLEDDFLENVFGIDYGQILLTHVFPISSYCHLISKQALSDMIRICTTKLLKSDQNSSNYDLYAKVLYSLLQNYPYDLTKVSFKLFKFFEQFFSSYGKENKLSCTLFEAVNCLLLSVGINVWEQVDNVKVAISNFIWKNWSTTNEDLKDQYILFFRILIRLYNLRINRVIDIDFAPKLFDLFVKEFSQQKNKLSFGREEKRATLEMECRNKAIMDLASDIFMIMAKRTEAAEINSNQNNQENGSRKKRRFYSIWEDIIGNLTNETNLNSSNSLWLQLLVTLISKYPSLVSLSITIQLITILLNILEKTKDGEEYCLESLQILAKYFRKLLKEKSSLNLSNSNNLNENLFFTSQKIGVEEWRPVWQLLLKKLPFWNSMCKEKGLQLMKTLVQFDLIDTVYLSQDILWKLPQFSDVDQIIAASVQFIIIFLQKHELLDPSNVSQERTLRVTIVENLFSFIEKSSIQNMNTNSKPIEPIHPTLLSIAILLLIRGGTQIPEYNHPTYINEFSKYILSEKDIQKEIFAKPYQKIELQLQTLEEASTIFQIPSSSKTEDMIFNSSARNQLSPSLRTSLKQKLLKFLHQHSVNLLTEQINIKESRKKTLGVDKHKLLSNLSEMIHFIHLTIDVLHIMNKQIEFQEYENAGILDSIQKIISCFSSEVEKLKIDSKLLYKLTDQIKYLMNSLLLTKKMHSYFNAFFQSVCGLIISNNSDSVSSLSNKSMNQEDLMDLEEVVTPSNSNSQAISSEEVYSDLCFTNITSSLGIIGQCNSQVVSEIANQLKGQLLYVIDPIKSVQICQSLLLFDKQNFVDVVLKAIIDLFLSPEYSGNIKIRNDCLNLLDLVLNKWKTGEGNVNKRDLCMKDFHEILQVFFELQKNQKLHWTSRKQYAAIIYNFLRLDNIENFNDFAQSFLNLLRDEDYRVRIFVSKTVTVFFELFESENGILEDIQKHLILSSGKKDEKISEEFLVTSTLALSEIACISPTSEASIIYLFCKFSQLPEYKILLPSILSLIANKTLSSSICKLLEYHLSFLVGKWMEEKQNLAQFPFSLLDCSSFEEFILTYEKLIVPKLVFARSKTSLVQVASVLGKNLDVLIKENFSGIFSCTFPLYFSPEEQLASEICEKFLNEFISDKDHNALIPKEFDNIILDLLHSLDFSPNSKSPSYSPDTINKLLQHLAQSWKLDIADILYKSSTSDRTTRILLHLNEIFLSSNRKQHRLRWFRVMDFFISLLKDKVCRPSVLRDTIHTILRHIGEKDLQDYFCELLLAVSRRAFTRNTRINELARHLNVIINSLIPFAQEKHKENVIKAKELNKSASSFENKPLQILKELIEVATRVPDSCNDLDPFPDCEPFQELNIKYNSLRGPVSLMEEISRFVKNKSQLISERHVSPVTRVAKLKHLKERFKQHKLELNQLFQSEYSENKVLLNQLIWYLIRECVPQNHEEIRYEVAQCLGELGTVDSSQSIAFSFNSTQNALSNNNDTLLSAKIEALHLLNSYLTDTDVVIVRLAAQTLKNVLSTESGGLAFEELKKESKEVSDYLMPYCKKSKNIVPVPLPLMKKPVDLNNPELWNPIGQPFGSWICNLCYSLASLAVQDEFLKLCADICKSKSEFAEKMFCYLIYDPILISNAHMCSTISSKIQSFILTNKDSPIEATQLILFALNFLRKYKTITFFWKHDFWKEINLLDVARSAHRSSAYFTALMFVELWCEQQFDKLLIDRSDLKGDWESYEQLILEIYSNINDPDGIYGIDQGHTIQSQILMYEHEGLHSKTIGAYDMLLQNRKILDKFGLDITKNLLSGLEKQGYAHLLEMYLKGFSSTYPSYSQELTEYHFENAWRSCKWDLTAKELHISEERDLGFHTAAYLCMKALQDGNETDFKNMVKKARLELVNTIGLLSIESTKSLYPAIVGLQFFGDIENVWSLRWNQSSAKRLISSHEIYSLQQSWKERLFLIKNDFDLFEPLLASRGVLLQILEQSQEVPSHLLSFAKLARKAKRFQIASNSIYQFKERTEDQNPGRLEESKILWDQGEYKKALSSAKSILNMIENTSELSLRNVYYCIGNWLAEIKTENPSTVKMYLQKSIDLYKESKEQETLCKTYFKLANYADNLYQSLITKLLSTEWQNSQELRKHKEKELTACKHLLQKTKADKKNKEELEKHILVLARQCELDKEENTRIEEDIQTFLEDAVTNYINCLSSGSRSDIRAMFRLCSLWFNNSNNQKITRLLKSKVDDISPQKFLPLSYQIASRMSSENNSFQVVLNQIIATITLHHPYHTLNQLLALRNGDKVQSEQRGKSRFVVDQDKIKAATNMINQLKNTKLREIIASTEEVNAAYIELAFYDVSSKKRETKPIPLSGEIRKIKNKRLVPVPTISLKIDPTCKYDDIVYIQFFDEQFKLVGGLNLPKLVECVGSDGRRYKQLVKCKDDLRQDAVMQQMFGLVNTLLEENPNTRKRRLKIRTYKVVPLTPSAGLLEWVENTTPIGEYLTGNSRNYLDCAHVKYRPNDKLSLECRKEISEASEKMKLQKFLEISTYFKPVFHHFFLEHFPDPAEWYVKRLTYTRSVASNSIVGYIVGLGDRHSHNILIDKSSAELVHIDLGVAFEQGKTLRTPELVPFRLTRDIVDGMGISGCEGVFRRCCEETMKVLRVNKEALLTIMEVFIHDPLYRWALSPLQALRLQREENEVEVDDGGEDKGNQASSSGSGNTDAERALLRLKQKLQGYEHGESLSVEGQINQLILEAQDPERLCKMFPGWAAWV